MCCGRRWDVVMLTLVLYCSVMEPFKAAFELVPTMQWCAHTHAPPNCTNHLRT